MEKSSPQSGDSSKPHVIDHGFFVRRINSMSSVNENLKKKVEQSIKVGDFSDLGPRRVSHGVRETGLEASSTVPRILKLPVSRSSIVQNLVSLRTERNVEASKISDPVVRTFRQSGLFMRQSAVDFTRPDKAFGSPRDDNSWFNSKDCGAKTNGGTSFTRRDKEREEGCCEMHKKCDLPAWGGKRRRSNSGFALQLKKQRRELFATAREMETSHSLLISKSSNLIESAKGSGSNWRDKFKHRGCRKTPISELKSRNNGYMHSLTCKENINSSCQTNEVGEKCSRMEHQSKIQSLGKGAYRLDKGSNTIQPGSLVENRRHENGASRDRKRVKKTLDAFRSLCRDLYDEGQIRRIDCEANRIMKARPGFVEIQKCIGSVPGVDVGMEFHYRMEVALVGLHKPLEAGIDLMTYGTKDVCVSVIAVGCGDYTNDMNSSEFITFSGQGGNIGRTRKEPEDQKLEKGNLALKNSITTQNPVRVIRGNKAGRAESIYIYDGLYKVEAFRQQRAAHGKLVFKFDLRKIPGQPQLSKGQWRKLRGR